jgi:hypothetical protein
MSEYAAGVSIRLVIMDTISLAVNGELSTRLFIGSSALAAR